MRPAYNSTASHPLVGKENGPTALKCRLLKKKGFGGAGGIRTLGTGFASTFL